MIAWATIIYASEIRGAIVGFIRKTTFNGYSIHIKVY